MSKHEKLLRPVAPRPWPAGRYLGSLGVCACLLAGALADDTWIKDELIPSPFELPSSPEMFRAVSQDAKPRWRKLYRTELTLPHRERHRSAFALGTLLCETLIAAEARDAQYVRNSVQDVKDCLTLLGLADALDERLPCIHGFAEKQNWPALRFEIEALEEDFRLLLDAQMDTNLAYLISLGHRMRCLDACAAIAQESGQTVGIDDPHHYATLAKQIDSLPAETKNVAFVADLREELERLRRRWEGISPEGDPSEHIAATAEKIRNYLNRTMEVTR